MAILNDLLVNGISRFVGSITADEIRGLGANYYGVCDTAAATAAKVVTCEGFVLKTGARISVKFTNGSTSTATMTLDVNGTGAKQCGIYVYNGGWQTYANRCEKNEALEFFYDGTYWVTLTPFALRNYANYTSRLTSANISLANGGLQYFLATSSMTTGKPPTDAHVLNLNWDNGSSYGAQLAVGHGGTGVVSGRIFSRGQPGVATWSSWYEVPRLSGALTNNQIVVSDESTGQALLKGGPTIGTGTTKFLREDGTWQTPNGTGTPYIDLGSAALSTGTSTTTGMSYTLTFTTATSALSSVTAPTIVMFTTIIDGTAAAFVGQYTKDLVVSPTTFKQIVGTCVMGTETKTFRVSIVPGMTTGTLLIDDVANIWRKTTSGGVVYPYNVSTTSNTFNASSLTMLSNEIQGITGIKTGESAINILAENHQNLAASTNAGVTSYTMSGVQDIGAVSSTICAENIYYYSVDGLNALKPTSVSSDGKTMTFASTLNPNNAITVLSFANYDEQGRSILSGAGLTNTHTCNVLVGAKLYNSGYFNLNIGQLNYSGGQASFVVGARNYTNANFTLTAGFRNTNIKTGAFVSGQWHDTTNGPDYLAAVGQYSSITSTSAFVVGNGTAANARSNAFEVHTDGRATVGAAPTADMDVATKKYVDDNSGGGTITGGGISGYLAKWTGTGAMSHELTVGPMIGTGTTKFLREDGTWQVPSGGGGGTTYVYHGTCETAAATTEKAVTCSEFTSDKLVTGATIFVTFTATNSAAVASITLNVNSTGAKNIKYLSNATVSNLPNTGYIIANMTYCFVYNGTYWVMTLYYNTNDQAYSVRHYYMNRLTSQEITSYKVMLLDKDGKYIPYATTSGATTYTKTINTTAFNPFAGIFWKYHDSTTSAGAKVGDAQSFNSHTLGYGDVRYSFNINSSGTAGTTALTSNTPIFIKAKYDFSTGLATLVPDSSSSNYLERSSIVQALPTTNPNDSSNFYIYIYFGNAYDKYRSVLSLVNEVYAWNSISNSIAPFTGAPFSGSGTFSMTHTVSSTTTTDTWGYYKQGKNVTVWGTFTGTPGASLDAAGGLPFKPAFSTKQTVCIHNTASELIYFCAVGLTANSSTFNCFGFSGSSTDEWGTWLGILKNSGQTITFSYITNE